MKLSDVVQKVQNTKWTKANNFNIVIMPLDTKFADLIGWEMSNELNDMMNVSLVSIDTPEYTNAELAEFIGNEWRYHVGRDELFRMTLTFRDYDQMYLYRKFLTAYNKGKDQYFNKIRFLIQVYNSEDKMIDESLLLETSDAIIESISHLQLNHNTENQIVEFSVRFKCQPPYHQS